jgi:uncharacterized protein YbjT (DUF2867 family)
MNKISLVAGATGRTGRIIIKKLLHQGSVTHALVRNVAAAEKHLGPGVIYHQGDVRKIDTLFKPLSGIDVVISALGAQIPVGKNCPKRVDYAGVSNLVQAALICGVQRFILLSSIAVTHPEHPLNHFGRVLDWKLKGEETLRKSGLDYAIVRPGCLKDTPGGQRMLTFGQGDHLLGTISRTDVAETCLYALKYPQRLGVTFEIIESDHPGQPDWAKVLSSLSKD